MKNCTLSTLLGLCIAGATVTSVVAATPPGFEEAAGKLQSAVVTVRVSTAKTETPTVAEGEQPKTRVTICSGVSLGNGLIVSPAYAGSDSLIRITLANGRQATAQLRVIDEYCGLSLFKTESKDLPALELADELPDVGVWVLSAAAWGIEKPVIGLGMLSGTDRSLTGVAYPPLLQCSMPTAETSSGAALTANDGKLIGIVVAADRNEQKGWSYAIPVDHVKRLLRANQNASQQPGIVTVLKRRRPVVGMILEGNNGKILVKRVTPGSPAEKAGIRIGNEVLETGGVAIRSVYQAVRPVLSRQPGDTVEYLVLQDGKENKIEVVLGGGVELPSAPFAQLEQYVRPKLDITGQGQRVVSRNARGAEREVYAPGQEPQKSPDSVDQRIRLLAKALDGYLNVIQFQQNKLSEEQKLREDTVRQLGEQIRQLQAEIDELKNKAGR